MDCSNRGATLTIGDKQYKVSVSEIEFTQETEDYNTFSGNTYSMGGNLTVSLNGKILSEKKIEHEKVKTVWGDALNNIVYHHTVGDANANLILTKSNMGFDNTIKVRQSGTAGFSALPWNVKETETVTKEYVDKNMGYREDEKACADEGYYESGDSLARKYRNLELDNDERLLRKHNIIALDGTLTSKGKDFILNVLFDHFTEEVVDALQEIDEADAVERNSK